MYSIKKNWHIKYRVENAPFVEHFLCYEATGNVASEGVADGVGKVASEVVGVEVAYVHHGGIVFAAEPPLTPSGVVSSEIAGVAAWRV